MSDERNEAKDERLDRELIELLNELRVALPGVQVLFAFLLTLPFTQRFEAISTAQENVYFTTFCTAIVSTAMFMTPTAFHRLRWRRYDKERMLEISNRTAIAGIAFLALSMCGAAYLIADVLFGAGGAAATVIGTAALLGLLWFTLPLARQMRDEGRPGS
jgi:high-affinity Fe2+/Pb2+ permease